MVVFSFGPDLVVVEAVDVLFGHVGGVDEGELAPEAVGVLGVDDFEEVEPVHLEAAGSDVAPDVGGLGVEQQGVEEVGHGLLVLADASVGEADVGERAHVVGLQVEGLVVDLQRRLDVQVVGHGRAVLVPQGVLGRVLADAVLEEARGLREVALDEGEHAEGQGDVGVLGLESVGLEEGVADGLEVGLGAEAGHQLGEVRVVLEPVVEVLDGLALLELVGAGDAQAEQRVQVERVDLVGLLERDDCVVVLVVLLVQLTHQPPGLCVLRRLLHLRLQTHYRLLRLPVLYQLLSDCDPIAGIFDVLILGLEGNDALFGCDLLLPLLAPLVCELRIELTLVHVLLLPLLHHIIDYKLMHILMHLH